MAALFEKYLQYPDNILNLQPKIQGNIIKYISDSIMIFTPDHVLCEDDPYIKDYFSLLEEVYASVDILRMLDGEQSHMSCKVSMHYCTDVYNMTFFKDSNDYYGKDIDLTARLLSKARENRIILSDVLYEKIIEELDNPKRPRDQGCLRHVSGRYVEDFKGVPEPTAYRFLETEASGGGGQVKS